MVLEMVDDRFGITAVARCKNRNTRLTHERDSNDKENKESTG
jgi:hypothetical protein